jgi:rifampicin phosphotransferase
MADRVERLESHGGTSVDGSSATLTENAFAVEWDDPADAELTWEWNDMHAPHALAPLAADYMATLAASIGPAWEQLGLPLRTPYRTINGYAYFADDTDVPEAELPALWERLKELRRGQAPTLAAFWTEECLPTVQRIHADTAGIDVDGASAPSLAQSWRGAWAGMLTVFTLHMRLVGAVYRVLEDLADAYEVAFPNGAAGDALALVQGRNDVLQEVDLGIASLADQVVARPTLMHWFETGAGRSLEALEALDGGAELAVAIREFLARHGHMGQAFDDLLLPSWAEAPSIFLGELGQRVATARASGESAVAHSEARRARLRAEAARREATVRDRLADRPQALERFAAALARAQEVGHLSETHNYWMDRMVQARLRTLSGRVGARLVREGVMDQRDDIFFLHIEEVAELIQHPTDRRQQVAERRGVHARNMTLRPPATLGKAPVDSGYRSRFDQTRENAEEADQLKGIGASAGVVRGPARIVLREDDFAQVAPGDIVVSPSASPSWVSIFPVAGGLVTNTGGALSHAAVVAREFGLPAVVGAAGATTLIPPGCELEIDGTAGTVRLI